MKQRVEQRRADGAEQREQRGAIDQTRRNAGLSVEMEWGGAEVASGIGGNVGQARVHACVSLYSHHAVRVCMRVQSGGVGTGVVEERSRRRVRERVGGWCVLCAGGE